MPVFGACLLNWSIFVSLQLQWRAYCTCSSLSSRVVFNTLTKHCVQLSTNGSRATSLKETNIIWMRGIWYFVAVFLAGSVSCYTNIEGENMIIRTDTVHISAVAVASGCGYVGVWLTCQMMWSGLSPWLQTSFWVLKRLVSKERPFLASQRQEMSQTDKGCQFWRSLMFQMWRWVTPNAVMYVPRHLQVDNATITGIGKFLWDNGQGLLRNGKQHFNILETLSYTCTTSTCFGSH